MCGINNDHLKEALSESWFVLFTKSRAEKKVYSYFSKKGFQTYLPLYSTTRQWSDRKKKVELPLINGMVFLKVTAQQIPQIYNCPLVSGILKELGKPAIVKDEEIENLKIISREWSGENIISQEVVNFQKGDFVKVKRGPFLGITGELIEINGKHRLLVQLKSLNIEFVVNIPKSHVKILSSKGENSKV